MCNPFEKEKIARNIDKQFLTLLGNVMAADCQCLGAADYQYFSLEISQFLLREIKMKVAFYYVIYDSFDFLQFDNVNKIGCSSPP